MLDASMPYVAQTFNETAFVNPHPFVGGLPMRASMASVALEVAVAHGITVAELRSRSRRRKFAWPRHEFIWRVAVELRHISYPRIGTYLGGMDHTSVWVGACHHAERNALDYPARRRRPNGFAR